MLWLLVDPSADDLGLRSTWACDVFVCSFSSLFALLCCLALSKLCSPDHLFARGCLDVIFLFWRFTMQRPLRSCSYMLIDVVINKDLWKKKELKTMIPKVGSYLLRENSLWDTRGSQHFFLQLTWVAQFPSLYVGWCVSHSPSFLLLFI